METASSFPANTLRQLRGAGGSRGVSELVSAVVLGLAVSPRESSWRGEVEGLVEMLREAPALEALECERLGVLVAVAIGRVSGDDDDDEMCEENDHRITGGESEKRDHNGRENEMTHHDTMNYNTINYNTMNHHPNNHDTIDHTMNHNTIDHTMNYNTMNHTINHNPIDHTMNHNTMNHTINHNTINHAMTTHTSHDESIPTGHTIHSNPAISSLQHTFNSLQHILDETPHSPRATLLATTGLQVLSPREFALVSRREHSWNSPGTRFPRLPRQPLFPAR